MLYLHGTDKGSALNILKYGFNDDHTVWDCSVPGRIYLVSNNDNACGGCDAVRFAADAGIFAAAKNKSPDGDVVIFGFDIPESIAESYLLPDMSCENMDGCFCVESEDLNALIRDDKIAMSVKIIKNAYIADLRPFYFLGACKKYFTLDRQLEEICDILLKSDSDFIALREIAYGYSSDIFENLEDFMGKAEIRTLIDVDRMLAAV